MKSIESDNAILIPQPNSPSMWTPRTVQVEVVVTKVTGIEWACGFNEWKHARACGFNEWKHANSNMVANPSPSQGRRRSRKDKMGLFADDEIQVQVKKKSLKKEALRIHCSSWRFTKGGGVHGDQMFRCRSPIPSQRNIINSLETCTDQSVDE